MRIVYMSEAAALMEPPRLNSAVISITEPGRACPITGSWGALLHVTFSDAEYDQGMIDRLALRNKRFDPDEKGFPSPAAIIPINRFIDGLGPQIEELVVHCHAGQRRSAAVALFASEKILASEFPQAETAKVYMNKTVYSLLIDPYAFKLHGKNGFIWRLFSIFFP